MDATPEGTEVLSERACWERLRTTPIGRLAVEVGGQPDIFPINYIVDDGTLVFRTRAGTKLAGSVRLQRVAFEIDGYDPPRGQAWSVVVKGRARSIERIPERYEAEDLPLFPWVTFAKPEFVRIVVREVSGRRFDLAHDAGADGAIGWKPAGSRDT